MGIRLSFSRGSSHTRQGAANSTDERELSASRRITFFTAIPQAVRNPTAPFRRKLAVETTERCLQFPHNQESVGICVSVNQTFFRPPIHIIVVQGSSTSVTSSPNDRHFSIASLERIDRPCQVSK